MSTGSLTLQSGMQRRKTQDATLDTLATLVSDGKRVLVIYYLQSNFSLDMLAVVNYVAGSMTQFVYVKINCGPHRDKQVEYKLKKAPAIVLHSRQGARRYSGAVVVEELLDFLKKNPDDNTAFVRPSRPPVIHDNRVLYCNAFLGCCALAGFVCGYSMATRSKWRVDIGMWCNRASNATSTGGDAESESLCGAPAVDIVLAPAWFPVGAFGILAVYLLALVIPNINRWYLRSLAARSWPLWWFVSAAVSALLTSLNAVLAGESGLVALCLTAATAAVGQLVFMIHEATAATRIQLDMLRLPTNAPLSMPANPSPEGGLVKGRRSSLVSATGGYANALCLYSLSCGAIMFRLIVGGCGLDSAAAWATLTVRILLLVVMLVGERWLRTYAAVTQLRTICALLECVVASVVLMITRRLRELL